MTSQTVLKGNRARNDKHCAECGWKIGRNKRADTLYCSGRCSKAASLRRLALAAQRLERQARLETERLAMATEYASRPAPPKPAPGMIDFKSQRKTIAYNEADILFVISGQLGPDAIMHMHDPQPGLLDQLLGRHPMTPYQAYTVWFKQHGPGKGR